MKPPGIHHWFYVPIVCVASYYFVQAQRDTRTLIQRATRVTELSGDTLAMVNGALKGVHKNGDDGLLYRASMLVANADSAMNAIKQASQQLNKASKANEPKAAVLVDESIAAVRSGQEAIGRLGTSLGTLNDVITLARDGTLPKVNASVDSLGQVILGFRPIEDSANGLLVSGDAVMLALKSTVVDADKLIADPNLASVAKNMADASKSGASAMLHVDKATGYIESDLSPKHIPLWQTIVEGAIGNAISIPFKRISQSVSVVNTPTVQTK